MPANQSPYDYQFEKLMELHQEGEGEESALFAELLRHGPAIAEPLGQFLVRQKEAPRLAVLISLLGKCMDDRGTGVLLRFLKSPVSELRRAAANAVGWNRARAGLETLDDLEGSDPDPKVREEARRAIEEILRDFPKLALLLKHHRPMEHSAGAIPEFQPQQQPDEHQRRKLMAALPRLLAMKYSAVPLHFAAGDQLHIAARSGSERRLIAPLTEITGHHVQLHSWSPSRIRQGIEKFYVLGDDDFCTFHDSLTPMAREEVIETILAGVRPEEPACPLDEVNDAVEAAQVFLSLCASMNLATVVIRHEPPRLVLEARDRSGAAVPVSPPQPGHAERFLTALRILAGLQPAQGLGEQTGGKIRCFSCNPAFTALVSSSKTLEREALLFAIEVEKEG